jgi:hypothetical protein
VYLTWPQRQPPVIRMWRAARQRGKRTSFDLCQGGPGRASGVTGAFKSRWWKTSALRTTSICSTTTSRSLTSRISKQGRSCDTTRRVSRLYRLLFGSRGGGGDHATGASGLAPIPVRMRGDGPIHLPRSLPHLASQAFLSAGLCRHLAPCVQFRANRICYRTGGRETKPPQQPLGNRRNGATPASSPVIAT